MAKTATEATGEKVLLRWDDLVRLTGMSRRWLERSIHEGTFPGPDKKFRRLSLWRPSTIDAWIAGGKAK